MTYHEAEIGRPLYIIVNILKWYRVAVGAVRETKKFVLAPVPRVVFINLFLKIVGTKDE